MAEATLEALDRLVPDIYDAASQPQMWPGVVARLCDTFNAAGAELVNAGILLSQRWVLHNFPEFPIQQYLANHARGDAVVPGLIARAKAKPLSFKFVGIPGLMETPLYEDVVAPIGLSQMCVAYLGEDAGHGFELIGLARSARQKAFDDRTVEGLARLVPHLRSAGIVQMRIEGAGEPFRTVLDGMSAAVIVLNRHGACSSPIVPRKRCCGPRTAWRWNAAS